MAVVKLASGWEMPMVGLGTYQIDSKDIAAAVDSALACGYRLFDTAAVYRNEEAVGEALRAGMKKYGIARPELFIITKLAPADQGYEAAKQAIQRSLNNLNMDYIDLYLIHWPGVKGLSPQSDEHATLRAGSWRAMEEAVDAGIIRSIGVSNYEISHLEQLKGARIPPSVNQIELHPLWYPKSLISWCQSHQIHVQAYSSLARGEMLKKEFLNEFPQFRAFGNGLSQVLLRWAVQLGFSVIPKSTDPLRIRSNFELSFELNEDEMQLLSNLPRQQKICWDPSVVK